MPARAAPPDQTATDLEHLKLLAIFHCIVGGLIILFSCLFIFHFVFTILLATNPEMFPMRPGQPEFPPIIMVLTAVVIGTFILAGWTLGLLTIYSGICLVRKKRRLLSMVVAGLQCAWVPVGTLLGAFTIIVLQRESVKRLYGEAPTSDL